MRIETTPQSRLELLRALRLMTEALAILDEVRAPGEIGSMLDLAIVRLDQRLGSGGEAAAELETLACNLEREFTDAPASNEQMPSPWEMPPL